jgi:hypothetical protein
MTTQSKMLLHVYREGEDYARVYLNVQEAWTSPDAIEGTTYAATASGWMDRATCNAWFERFVQFVNEGRERREDGTLEPVLLIFDGHDSHISLEIAIMAEENGVHLYQLPAHTSHRTQPLDLACFQTWHREFSKTVFAQLRAAPRTQITRDKFAALMKDAWLAAFSPSNVASGFRAAGLYPYDPDRLTAHLGGLSPASALSDRPHQRGDQPVAQPADPGTAPTTPARPGPAAPTPERTVTPPEELMRKRKADVVDRFNDLERRVHQLEDTVAHRDLAIAQAVFHPPAVPAQEEQRKRRRLKAIDAGGKARVVTADEIRAGIARADAERVAREAEKRRQKSAAKAPSGEKRKPGRPRKAPAPTPSAPGPSSAGAAGPSAFADGVP